MPRPLTLKELCGRKLNKRELKEVENKSPEKLTLLRQYAEQIVAENTALAKTVGTHRYQVRTVEEYMGQCAHLDITYLRQRVGK